MKLKGKQFSGRDEKVKEEIATFSVGREGKIVSVQVLGHDIGVPGNPVEIVVWYWE